jgi:hypothetical protein
MMELRILNCHISLTEHAATEAPTEKRDEVALVELDAGGALKAAMWNGTEWRDDKRRPFKSPVRRWFSIGDARVGA